MASSHGTPPIFNNKVIAWVDHRLPIFSYIEKEYHTFPTPRNFNYFWNFGAIATVKVKACDTIAFCGNSGARRLPALPLRSWS